MSELFVGGVEEGEATRWSVGELCYTVVDSTCRIRIYARVLELVSSSRMGIQS